MEIKFNKLKEEETILKRKAKGEIADKNNITKKTPLTPYQGELEGRCFSFETTFITNEEHKIKRFEKNPFLDLPLYTPNWHDMTWMKQMKLNLRWNIGPK